MTGEASEADSEMVGVELTADDVEARRIAEQIAEMVKENPDEAAMLLNRWITADG